MSSTDVIRRAGLRAAMLAITACGVFTTLPAPSQESGSAGAALQPAVSILEIMEKTITPASNTIWSFYQAPTEDSQWASLEEAAVTMVAASSLTAAGGTGPMDNEWVRDPSWQAFNRIMLQASQDALKAIRARDHAALLEAADVLYPPCEGCHSQFNPGVVNAQ